MPYLESDGTSLYYEEVGSGTPIIFAHEFANDLRGWETQLRYFSRSYRCVAYNARGYPPSAVSERDDMYSQQIAADDIGGVLDHLGEKRAFIVGLSMGASAALHFTIQHPERVLGLVFASGGSGSDKASRERFNSEAVKASDIFLSQGMGPFVEVMSYGPTRVQLLNKDPRGWKEFGQQLSEHSPLGAALTMRNYQAKRPSLFDLKAQLKTTRVPTLIVAGDEDDPVIETSLFLKRCLPASGLAILPKTGHSVNLEEPAAFNQLLQDFFGAVERQKWVARDSRAESARSAMLADASTVVSKGRY
jgi:pimeloyl-ACP methyl ester carboxylesterase